MWFKMHPWVFPIIIGGIGILYLIINIGAIIETKKNQAKGSDHHISGIPLLGGIQSAYRRTNQPYQVAGVALCLGLYILEFSICGICRRLL